VSGHDVDVLFHSRRVRVVEATPAFIPVVGFGVSTYWERHYRSKPFFVQRTHFAGVNGGKAVSGRSVAFSEAAVGGSVGSKVHGAAAGRGSANAHRLANLSRACQNGQKNCKTAGQFHANANGKFARDTGGRIKAATAGKTATSDIVTGSIGAKGGRKNCQPGSSNCNLGANGNVGAGASSSGAGVQAQ